MSSQETSEFWINRAGDALGRFAAEGGEGGKLEVIDAENGVEVFTLIAVPREYQELLVAAINRGRLMERVGVRLPEDGAADARPLAGGMKAGHAPDEWQRQCLATWGSAGDSLRDQQMHALMGLAGETGEVADLLKKHFFKPGRAAERADVLDELADVAYYVAVNAHLWGITFEDLFGHLAAKLAGGHGWVNPVEFDGIGGEA